MRRLLPSAALVTLLLVNAGCLTRTPVSTSALSTSPLTRQRKLVTLQGIVNAPASIIANNGSGLISDKGLGLISNNGGGLISKVKYHVADAEPWTPVAQATVLVLDQFQRPLKSVAAVTTDAQGHFTLQGVPAGNTWVVEVQTAGPRLRTLAKPDTTGGEVPVDPATTVVTEHLRQAFVDQQGALSQVPIEHYARLAEAVRGVLQQGEVPIDVSSQQAAVAVFEAVVAKHPEIQEDGKQVVVATQQATQEAVQKGEVSQQDLKSPPPDPEVVSSPVPSPGTSLSPAPAPSPQTSPGTSTAPTIQPSVATSSQPQAPRPTLDSLSVTTGSPGMRVTLAGSGFSAAPADNTVAFNGIQAEVLQANSTSLVVTVPAAATDGAVSVSVGGQAATGPSFHVVATGSVIASYNVGTEPRHLTFDAAGNLWVTNRADFTVTKLSPAGQTLGTFAVGFSPYGLAFDSAGNAWVACKGSNSVWKLDSGGNKLGAYNTGTGPVGVLLDPEDHAWVTNFNQNSVTKLSNTGSVLGTYAVDSTPQELAQDANGNVWVADWGLSRVSKLSSSGAALGTYTVGLNPTDIVIDGENDCWVADTGDNNLKRLGQDGSVLLTLPTAPKPEYLALDPRNVVWVTHQGSNTLSRYARPTGKLETFTVGGGSALQAITLDALGYVWVATAGNQVLKLAP